MDKGWLSTLIASDLFALVVSVAGINTCYLYYGFLQEKLLTTDYLATATASVAQDPSNHGERFTFVIVMVFCQCAVASCVALGVKWGSSAGLRVSNNRRLIPHLAVAVTTPSPHHHLHPGVPPPHSSPSKKPSQQQRHHTSRRTIIQITGPSAMFQIAAMACSNLALKHLSYPMQSLAKSCKMIPVMLVSAAWNRTPYTVAECLAVLLLTLGIAAFSLPAVSVLPGGGVKGAPATGDQADQFWGCMWIVLSLMFDGATGATQDSAVVSLQPTFSELMLYQNTAGTAVLGALLALTGEGHLAASWMWTHPMVAKDLLMFSVAGAAGQIFIFVCIRRFGALVCSMITTTRKFLSVLLSVIAFGHHLSLGQWVSVGMVFGGVLLEVAQKHRRKVRSKTNIVQQKKERPNTNSAIKLKT